MNKNRFRILLKSRKFGKILKHRPYRVRNVLDRAKYIWRLSCCGRHITAAIMDWFEFGSSTTLRYRGISFHSLVENKGLHPLDAFLELDRIRRGR